MSDSYRDKSLTTRAIHSGKKRSQFNELSEAIYLTQGFSYPSAETAEARFIESGKDEFIYARYGNPTVAMFEERCASIEGAEDAFATSSGMGAVSSTLYSLLKAGDHIVAARALFGSCLYICETLLPRFGVEVTFVDGSNIAEWEAAIQERTKLVFFETLSNPTLEIVDIKAVAQLAHSKDALVVVDNVFVTPIFQETFTLGADIVIYSATKHIDGQGRALGGIVLSNRDFIRAIFEPYIKHTGAALSPFNAWIMLKGLETLSLRVHAQADSALKIAHALEKSTSIKKVIYPYLPSHPQHNLAKKQMTKGGTVLAFDVEGGKEAAFKMMNHLKIAEISNNLGDAKTIITHPATTTHQRLSLEQRDILGITDGLVRLSVGLEDVNDLIDDFNTALCKA